MRSESKQEDQSHKASQAIIGSLDAILNEMECYWEILSRKVTRHYLHCVRITLDVELRLCRIELKETNVEVVRTLLQKSK